MTIIIVKTIEEFAAIDRELESQGFFLFAEAQEDYENVYIYEHEIEDKSITVIRSHSDS